MRIRGEWGGVLSRVDAAAALLRSRTRALQVVRVGVCAGKKQVTPMRCRVAGGSSRLGKHIRQHPSRQGAKPAV